MCGICGYISNEKISDIVLHEMNDTMFHRGPDDSGIWEHQNGINFVGFAQRRLAIMDLSPLGHQPMESDDKNLVITYNGEVYNFKELRTELENKGYLFRSQCDTEVVLAAYKEWEENCFSKFNGMFAIAIYDRMKDKLVLARDKMGKKPLYYYYKNTDFIFASELKPIMKCPLFHKEINRDAIGNYLCNKFIAAPETIFLNTFKMKAGTYLVYQNGKIDIKKYWSVLEKKQQFEKEQLTDYNMAKSQLKLILQDAVSCRMIADVPVGVFLSGGIDSALVTGVCSQFVDRVQSFSIGFYDKERDEAPYAREIAKHLGTQHCELYVSEKDILSMLEELPKYYDEPFSDSSQLPSMLVSQMAVSDITVALTGDGGDELFCGYSIYDLVNIAQKTDKIGDLLRMLPGMKYMKRFFPSELRAFVNNENQVRKVQLFTDVMAEEVDKILIDKLGNYKFKEEDNLLMGNWQERRMLLDMQTYLPDEVLCKMDRASMKYSLETRCPLLDYRVVECSFRIPHEFKYYHKSKKYILKDLAYEYVPKELLDRPKKGFGVPLRKWLRSVLKEEIENFARPEMLKKQGIFHADAIQRLRYMQEKSDKIVYSSILWSFYVFQRWYQYYIEDLWTK